MILAVDIGGTKTLVAAFDLHGRILKSQRIPTDHRYADFISHLVTLIKKEFWHADVTTIHVAVAGFIDYKTRQVTHLGNLPWRSVDLVRPLTAAFGVSVLIDNDANVGGLAEAHELHSKPQTLLYVTIGTGIGSGIITKGEINPFLAHSEAGHIMLEHQGVLQRWEDLCSGRALVRDYHQTAAEIDDPEIWKDFTHKLSLGFLAMLPIVQPDVVVIGGGIGTHFKKYGHLLSNRLRTTLPALVPLPPIVQAIRPEEAVIYGCYLLAKQTLAR